MIIRILLDDHEFTLSGDDTFIVEMDCRALTIRDIEDIIRLFQLQYTARVYYIMLLGAENADTI